MDALAVPPTATTGSLDFFRGISSVLFGSNRVGGPSDCLRAEFEVENRDLVAIWTSFVMKAIRISDRELLPPKLKFVQL